MLSISYLERGRVRVNVRVRVRVNVSGSPIHPLGELTGWVLQKTSAGE